jgi:transcriptional regulator with GAF, ATPase, and Fis domain
MYPNALQAIAIALAAERSLDLVLERIVAGLAEQPGMALARIWLVRPGDICERCPMRAECPDRERCLHLVASLGASLDQAEGAWAQLGGAFRRFPLSVRKIGRIGATGEPIFVPDIAHDSAWIVRPEWAERERVRSFAGEPLVFRGEVLGVLGIFSRARLRPEDASWLRTFADHAAVAIANARAFEEIDRLREQLEQENAYLREEVKTVLDFSDIVGVSPRLEKVLRQVELVAPTDTSVLVTGESGTGKELIASAIHERSDRSSNPLIRVNCAAVPAELFESEFFGHVKGSFTGAHRDRVGRFELADGGTLFLDEVGEIPLALQSKLLRVVQEGRFERVGEERTRRANVRIVAATNRDLKHEAAEGRFRQDLYFRLSVFPIEVPPLRERLEDIPLLAEHFLSRAASRLNLRRPALTARNVHELQAYDWPGNVRELQNVLERAVILSRGGGPLRLDLAPTGTAPVPRDVAPEAAPMHTAADLERLEREAIEAALARAGGKLYGPGGAAELFGMKPTTLASRMKRLGLRKGPA